VFIFAVQIFEGVRVWFALFKLRWVYFKICLATPGEVAMMFDLVRSIVFNVS